MNNNQNNNSEIGNKGGGVLAIIIIIILIALIGSCGSDDSSYSRKYSDDYYNDKSYRDNVNKIADVYGEDPADVDRKINDVVDAINDKY